MAYRSELEARLAKKTTKAIVDYQMIEDGDRVMVGLSGGKDSWALLQMLDVLRQRAPIRFSLVAVNVDSGYKEYKHDLIASTCEARGWEYRIEHTDIGELIDDILDADETPCSLCARLRRGVLYRIASEVGATKIALGHHADDFIETLLLNLFFAGALKAMPAKLVSDDGAHVVIRPLVYVGEDEARAYAKECELPIIGCCCPACGDLGLQRQRTKRLLMELEREHPGVKQSMLKALSNVAPRHLLDTRLNPPAELKARAARLRRGSRASGRRTTSSHSWGPASAGPTREGGRPARVARRRHRRRSDRWADRSRAAGLRRRRAGRWCRRRPVHRRQDSRPAHLRGSGRSGPSCEPVGPGCRRRGAGRLAVHAGRRLPEGAAAVVRPGGAASGGAAAVRGRGPRAARQRRSPSATGEFQAMMQVSLVNDGPVTLLLDSSKQF